MVATAFVLKAAALGTAAVTGVAGLAWSATATGSADNPAAVWVDGPLDGFTVEPGLVPVTAHASSTKEIGRLDLLVDGAKVSSDSDLERSGLLSLATFGWQATPGTHSLVVRSESASSDVVHVVVAARAGAKPVPSARPTASAAPSLTATPGPTPTASGSPSAPPSASPTASVTTAPTTGPSPTAAPSPTPVRTSAPPTPSPTPKPSPPAYAAGSIRYDRNLYWDTNSGGAPCPQGHTATATATVTNATAVSIEVGGTAFTATRSGTTWSATIDTSRISGAHNTGPLPVRVLSRGAGGSATSNAGTVTVYSCSKD